MRKSVNERRHSLECVRNWSELDVVADAVSVALEHCRMVYVERRGECYRWSLTHRGGAYPLLRITAQYIDVDYNRLRLGYRTLTNGPAILCGTPEEFDEPDSWSILEFEDGANRNQIEGAIESALSDSCDGGV